MLYITHLIHEMYTRKKNNYTILLIFWFLFQVQVYVIYHHLMILFRYDDGNAQESNSFDVLYAVYINYMTNLRWIPIYVCFYAAVVSLYIYMFPTESSLCCCQLFFFFKIFFK